MIDAGLQAKREQKQAKPCNAVLLEFYSLVKSFARATAESLLVLIKLLE